MLNLKQESYQLVKYSVRVAAFLQWRGMDESTVNIGTEIN